MMKHTDNLQTIHYFTLKQMIIVSTEHHTFWFDDANNEKHVQAAIRKFFEGFKVGLDKQTKQYWKQLETLHYFMKCMTELDIDRQLQDEMLVYCIVLFEEMDWDSIIDGKVKERALMSV